MVARLHSLCGFNCLSCTRCLVSVQSAALAVWLPLYQLHLAHHFDWQLIGVAFTVSVLCQLIAVSVLVDSQLFEQPQCSSYTTITQRN